MKFNQEFYDSLPEEGKREFIAWSNATPRERAEVQGIPCEHPDQEDGYCLECGAYLPLEAA